jgi:alkylation response protein AidB-like acyl-CoA dehydrogenase
MMLPRRYGGLSLPVSIATVVIEMISRADASLMNVFGLQDIGETINKFASEEIKAAYLPRFSSGEVTGSMALTEPDAGSDLQNVQLKARLGEDGRWYLTGVKRFITNGCGEISLVLARSEEGTTDGRGLSLFLYEREEHLKIRRLEDKLGIHGSPTCEMQFDEAPALLVGERRRGLITYVSSLMDGARLAIGAQAVGIAEAAYQAAEKYSGERVQFGAPIRRLPAVAAMLADMSITVKAARALLYETALIVDLKEGLEREAERQPEKAKDLRPDIKRMTRLAGLYTPLCKAFCAEAANRAAYDSLQIHGGSGYMRDFAVERHLRDARITNIYEGTTQLQVVAAIGGVLSGILTERLDEYDTAEWDAVPELRDRIRAGRHALEAAVAHVRSVQNPEFRDFNAGRLVAMAADLVCCSLLARDAARSAERLLIARRFVREATHRVEGLAAAVLESRPDDLDDVFALASP